MIVFVIKSFFCSKAGSYNLEQKPHTSHFFLFFCRQMIRVAYTILAIVIEDLEVHFGNLNLLLRKSLIWFEPLAQKRRLVSKRLIHYTIDTKSLFYRGIYLSRENLGQNLLSILILNCHNFSDNSTQTENWRDKGEIWDCDNSQ